MLVFPADNKDAIKFVYITDLNLYPTPAISQRVKSFQEKSFGLLLNESQAVFQEIISYINNRLDPDFVVFGGNSISISKSSNNFIYQLFLDMISEIKSKIFIVFSRNEINVQDVDELIRSLNSIGTQTNNTWWSYLLKDYLLIGLDDVALLNSKYSASLQIKWLKDVLKKNKNHITVIFLHQSIISPGGKGEILENVYVKDVLKIIRENSQVKLVISGGEYLNRIKLLNNTVFVISSSPIAYPCSFKLIEISTSSLKIKTINIALKGIIKKAKQSLIESEFATKLYPKAPKSIVNYVEGENSDSNFEYHF